MSDVLSIYVAKESGVHRLNPLTKLSMAGLLLVSGLSVPGIWTNYALFALTVLPLAIWGRVLAELIGKTWKVVLPFAISVFLIQGFLWPGGTPVLYIGPFSLKSEGLIFATTSTGRILMVVSSFIWFALTTRPDRLMTSLAQRGLPSTLAYIIVATIQIAPRFQARATTILEAQQARGLETGGKFSRRVRAIVPLVVPLILSSLVDVEERALAIEARAFNRPGKKTSLVEIPDASWEAAARWMLVLGMAGVVAASIWWRVKA
jgi:energy-coupling factor transport system permease protein